MTRIPARDLRDSDVILCKEGKAKVIETYKDLSAPKATGCVIRVKYFKNGLIREFRVNPNEEIERLRMV